MMDKQLVEHLNGPVLTRIYNADKISDFRIERLRGCKYYLAEVVGSTLLPKAARLLEFPSNESVKEGTFFIRPDDIIFKRTKSWVRL